LADKVVYISARIANIMSWQHIELF